MKLSQIAKILNASLKGLDAEVSAINTDTRHIKPGELFIALQGPHFDGNQFVNKAAQEGAVGAIVTNNVNTIISTIRVKDTREALAQLACYWRRQINCPLVAVTGSCGKTTTRALLASIFSQCGYVLASESSFNNEIGVPLTILRLTPDHDYGILELGANHEGEIAYLTRIVNPDVAIITNAAPAHLEGFGDLDGVARAKGEIYQGLSSSGTAIINNDDRYASYWRGLVVSQRCVTFGIDNAADIMATDIQYDKQQSSTFKLCFPKEKITIHLPLMGEHNIRNALAAAAAGYAFNLPLAAIKLGLETVLPVARRLVESRGCAGALIIDDSYNANPSSVAAAIDVLTKRSGDSFLVLGDMLELGKESEQLHYQIGVKALQSGVTQLYCYGDHSKQAAKAFGKKAYHFDDQASLVQALRQSLHEDSVVLVKGSLGMKMNNIVLSLLEE